eukprot:m.132206 g.132206  ORF g.132206 m.132206 type:complete len:174 (+) comp52375_c0_seq3:279-800(+)
MSLCAQFPPFLLQKPTRVLPNCALPNGASSPPRTVPEMDRKPLIAFARRVAPALVAMARFHPSLPVLYEDKELVFSAAGTRITPPTQPSAQKPSAALTLPELKAPNFHKLLDTAKMSADELARALDWPLEDINSLLVALVARPFCFVLFVLLSFFQPSPKAHPGLSSSIEPPP